MLPKMLRSLQRVTYLAIALPLCLWNCLQSSPCQAESLTLAPSTEHADPVNVLVFSPNSKILARGGGGYLGSEGHAVRLWNVASGKELPTVDDQPKMINALVFSPDGKKLVGGCQDSTVRVWDLASGKQLQKISTNALDGIQSVAISLDGKKLVSGTANRATVWDFASGKKLCDIAGVGTYAVNADGTQLIGTNPDRSRINYWDMSTGKQLSTGFALIRPHERADAIFVGDVSCISLSAIGKVVALGESGGTLVVQDLTSGKVTRIIETAPRLDGNIEKLALSSDGRTLADCGWDHITRIWDVASGKELHTLSRLTGDAQATALSPDCTAAAGASNDGRLELWTMARQAK